MTTAILGWGSLLWDPREDFDQHHEVWLFDGPCLKLEFSRISSGRSGALTLVVDNVNGAETQVAWCRSTRRALSDAIADLRCREGCSMNRIGVLDLSRGSDASEAMADWATRQGVAAVIWTALPSNFKEKRGEPFSLLSAKAYLQSLPPEGKAAAAEYIWRAPAFVDTPLRRVMETEPWHIDGTRVG